MALRIKPSPERPELIASLAKSAKQWDRMTGDEKEAVLREQRKSWVRQDMD